MNNERTFEDAYQRLTFCLLGVATPNELIKDRRTTPYNVGRTLELRDFDAERDDLTPLALALNPDLETGQALLARVLHWTGRHPYLTIGFAMTSPKRASKTPTRQINVSTTRLGRWSGMMCISSRSCALSR